MQTAAHVHNLHLDDFPIGTHLYFRQSPASEPEIGRVRKSPGTGRLFLDADPALWFDDEIEILGAVPSFEQVESLETALIEVGL